MTNHLALLLTIGALTTAGAPALAQGGQCGGRFFRADTNGDGKVTWDEAQAHGKQMFQLRDKNKDGVITRDELPGRGQNFQQADKNNDGKVTFQEHEANLRERFNAADANKDGVLSGDELGPGPGGRGGGPRGR